MKIGLSLEDLKKIRSVFQTFPEVRRVILYGSRAKGNYRPGSDIDLMIRDSKVNLQTLNRISASLESLNLPYTFDLSIFEKIEAQELIEHVLRVGKVFYEAD